MSSSKEKTKPELVKLDVKEGEIVTHNSFYHLKRKIKDKTYVFRRDYRTGWFGVEADEKELKNTPREAWTKDGFEMPPFTQKEVEEFRGLSDEDLLKYIK